MWDWCAKSEGVCKRGVSAITKGHEIGCKDRERVRARIRVKGVIGD